MSSGNFPLRRRTPKRFVARSCARRARGFTLIEVLVTTIMLAVFSLFLFQAFFRQLTALDTLAVRMDVMPYFHQHEVERRLSPRETQGKVSPKVVRGNFMAQDNRVDYKEKTLQDERYQDLYRTAIDYSWSAGSKIIRYKREFQYVTSGSSKT